MDLIKQEIERKRKASATLGGNTAAGGKKKWVTKGDLEKARVAQYHDGKEKDEKARQTSSDARADAGQPLAHAVASGGGDASAAATAAVVGSPALRPLRPGRLRGRGLQRAPLLLRRRRQRGRRLLRLAGHQRFGSRTNVGGPERSA